MKKGLSDLISASIIILITITVGVLVSSWVVDVSKSRASDITGTTKQRLACQYAGFSIENVTFNCSSNCASDTNHNLTVKLTNTGQKTLEIDRIYVINTSGSLYTFMLNETKTLDIGSTIFITNISRDACSGINSSISNVKVSSPNCSESASDTFVGSEVSYLSC